MSKDFRVGDVVCDIVEGTGKVHSVSENSTYNVMVDFPNDTKTYTNVGKRLCCHEYPSLYHGTWEEVFGHVKDVKPKRKVKKWVNLYYSNGVLKCGELRSTKELAEYYKLRHYLQTVEVEIDEELT